MSGSDGAGSTPESEAGRRAPDSFSVARVVEF